MQKKHGEAFMLMRYSCEDCGHSEIIWNSRDGVTPFGTTCPSCGNPKLYHVDWKHDTYAPEHKLNKGQKFWRDGTIAEGLAIMRKRFEQMKPPAEVETVLLRDVTEQRNEWAPGWPVLDIKEYR